MAKKQITSNSTPLEISAAQEQLSQAQQEFNSLYRERFNNQAFSASEISQAASEIAAKYDYVDFGQMQSIGGDQFFVQGLGNQTNSVAPPAGRTTINLDDGFATTRPQVVVEPRYNQKGISPNQRSQDNNVYNETSPVPAIESNQVRPDKSAATIGSKEASQVGAALDSTTKAKSVDAASGIVSQNNNALSNNSAGRLSDQYAIDPTASNFKRAGNTDDLAKVSSVPEGSQAVTPDTARTASTGSATAGTAKSINIPNAAPGTNNKAGIEVKPNQLHEYANWTYKIAWYMLTNDTYNSIMTSGTVSADKGTLIAKSGGVGANTNPALEGDLYFRSLRINSAIGNRLSAAATNNFELEMVIVEPYGASLIGQLAAMAANTSGQNSISPSEVPYLLEIDFDGYKDDGTMVTSILKDGKKYIPVKILTVEMSLESGGASYRMTMAPYSFYAQTPRYAEMEFGVTIGGNTVEEMLGKGKGLMKELNDFEKLKKQEGIITVEDEYDIAIFSFNPAGNTNLDLANSKFAYPQQGGESTILKRRPATKNGPSLDTYTISRGSVIKEVIKNVILSSQYFNEKVKPDTPTDKSKPAELIKVIPVIEVTNNFDPARNEFAKKIMFKVFNTLNYGEVIPYVGNAPVSEWGYCKEYNWLFTGKNADIIECNLSFNMVYFTKMQTNILDHNSIKYNQLSVTGNRTPSDMSFSSVKSMAQKVFNLPTQGSNVPQRYINATIAAEWFDSKMNNANADNVSLDLRIIGDPDWIPQDASVCGGLISIGEKLYDAHNSIAVDVAGVYVRLNLRTPRDYNPTTGLVDISNEQLTVQGIYQVITVESNFEDGRFTQTLNMVKVPNQEDEKPKSAGQNRNDQINEQREIRNNR